MVYHIPKKTEREVRYVRLYNRSGRATDPTVVNRVYTPLAYWTTSPAPKLHSPNVRFTNVMGPEPTVYPKAQARIITSIRKR